MVPLWAMIQSNIVSVAIETPRLEIIKKYKLDKLMTASEVSASLVHVLSHELCFKVKICEAEMKRQVYELFRTLFQLQFEARGLIIDLQLINSISSDFTIGLSNLNEYNIHLNPEWHTKVDQILHTWVCKRCNLLIRGVPHPPEECDYEMIDRIIDS